MFLLSLCDCAPSAGRNDNKAGLVFINHGHSRALFANGSIINGDIEKSRDSERTLIERIRLTAFLCWGFDNRCKKCLYD